jgi:hypothetical protein
MPCKNVSYFFRVLTFPSAADRSILPIPLRLLRLLCDASAIYLYACLCPYRF